MNEFKPEDGWVEMPDFENETWCPKEKGEQLQGIYINKRENVGLNHANMYTIKNEDGEWVVFGTEALNNKLKNVPIGYEVGIIYMGEKPTQPPKKPFKMFKVFRRAVGSKKEKEPKQPQMNLEDDSETWAIIDGISLKLEDKHEKINEKNITAMALKMRNDPTEDFTKEEFEDVKRVVKNINFD
ncbi:MAG: hypothetical protein K8E24_002970 [Methanobacterium paludis]|nr:hypothetical protein [Methanobacterium paludis]